MSQAVIPYPDELAQVLRLSEKEFCAEVVFMAAAARELAG